MKIQPIKYQNQSFKAATININAFSDTHGELYLADNALEEMRNRKKDIFCRNEKGKTNVLAICGDWFMDGGRKGYKANPDKPLAIFQSDIFNEFISQIKKIATNTNVLFTPGNHEFDGGVPLLDEILASLNADTLMTNLDLENSSGFKKSISNNKIINEKVLEVDDDKNPNLKHKLLFLGVIPVNLQMYQKNLNGISLTNNSTKPQALVKKEDYEETLQLCKSKIENFKENNPNGIVIVMCHTGVEFADNLAKEAPVNIIFDGHEHKDDIRRVNSTPIIPLLQNFKKIVNAKIKINDNGVIESIRLKDFNPINNKKKGPLCRFYHKLFREDLEKSYSVKTKYPNMKSLDTKNIRLQNNYLANFVTDSILEELQKQDPQIDFFALNSSAIRHPLKVSDKKSISSFDVMNVLSGIKEEDGQIMLTDVSGLQLTYMVLDNLLFNKDLPQKNPLIHYAGLSINKTKILEEYKLGASLEKLSQYIIDQKTNKPINPTKSYKIANVEKYFNKSQNPKIKDLKNKSQYLGDSVQSLFKQHFDSSNDSLFAKCDVRIY